MGFNRRKMEADRKAEADVEAAARRATDAQVLEDAERLIGAWNERQAKRMPMLFSPTIGAAITAGYWFLWVRCPACRTINAIDLRMLDHHRNAAVLSNSIQTRPPARFKLADSRALASQPRL
jgi:phage FluMu protein Com